MSIPKIQLQCQKCGHSQFKRVTTKNRDGHAWHILECAKCQHIHELQTGYAEFKQFVEVFFDPNPHKLFTKEKEDEAGSV
jgi:uncharacterized Zn finger protein